MSREEKLTEFVAWAQHYITGDEKGQAQIFLDRLFQAFGHPGVLDISQGSQPQSATATSGPTSSPRASAIRKLRFLWPATASAFGLLFEPPPRHPSFA